MIPKQYMIIAVVLACVFFFGFGYKTGGNAVRVEYQDAINQQKAEADKIIQQNIDDLLSTQAENNSIKDKLEKERQNNVKTTNDLRTKLANSGLRFKSNQCGSSSKDSLPTESNSSSDTSSTSVELPSEIGRNLRELAFDCDTLRDDYSLLYKFTQESK
jgi:hypothetical protein